MLVNFKYIDLVFMFFNNIYIFFNFKKKKELIYNYKCLMKDNCLLNEVLLGNMRMNYFVMFLRCLC